MLVGGLTAQRQPCERLGTADMTRTILAVILDGPVNRKQRQPRELSGETLVVVYSSFGLISTCLVYLHPATGLNI